MCSIIWLVSSVLFNLLAAGGSWKERPIFTVTRGRPSSDGLRSSFSVPVIPTGRIGTPLRMASSAGPGKACCSWPRRLLVPSGNTIRTKPCASICSAWRNAVMSGRPRCTGNAPRPRMKLPVSLNLNNCLLAMNLTGRWKTLLSRGGSASPRWLDTTSRGPRSGIFSLPLTWRRVKRNSSTRTITRQT